jgi:glycosyltransferase involved in cell wall biosynthesis
MSQDPLHLVCIEPSFPGRLGAVADWLVRRRGYRCEFYCQSAASRDCWPAATGKGLDVVQFRVNSRAGATVNWTSYLERGICYAYGSWEALEERRPRPVDLVLGRSAGLGSTLFAPVHFPRIPVVNLFDYFYHGRANDLAEEAPPDTPLAYFHWRRAANAMDLLDLESVAAAWVPTQWQCDLYPVEYRADFTVLYDGVDTRRFVRRTAGPRLVAGRTIAPQARVVTFVAGVTDRVRGFDRFVTLANRLQQEHANVICLVVGDAVVQRGLDVQFFSQDYRAHLLRQVPLHDAQRYVFLGAVPPPVVAEVLAASDLHVYPSRPYPVARSLVEALAAGCVALAWDNEPVREFITHGQTGLLVADNDLEEQVRQALAVLRDPAGHSLLGESAAALVRERYSQDVTLPQLARLFDRLTRNDKSGN